MVLVIDTVLRVVSWLKCTDIPQRCKGWKRSFRVMFQCHDEGLCTRSQLKASVTADMALHTSLPESFNHTLVIRGLSFGMSDAWIKHCFMDAIG